MLLVVFDIDGTLVQSMAADSRYYARALRETLKLANGHRWMRCRDTTDPGILDELFFEGYRRRPTVAEISRFRDRFVDLLERHCAREALAPVPGARAMLAEFTADPDIGIAYGTGAWRRSAELKMASAGMPLQVMPGATGDDAVTREGIVQTAIERARRFYRVDDFERAVYVGDGVWDVRACRNLNLPFVGVGGRAAGNELRQAGADCVVRDFADRRAFLDLLHSARCPRPLPDAVELND